MSIIRSNIARQLLAEGGAPRASFRNGGARTDANTMSGSGAAFDDGFDTGEEFGRDTYAQQYEAMNVPDAVSRGGGDNEPSFFQKAKDTFKNFETDSRMNRVNRGLLKTPAAIKSVVGLKDIPPQLLATLADDYTQGGLFSEGLVGGDISLANAARTLEGLQELGVDLTGDIRSQVGDISRSKFAERFGPKTKGGEGGDNEPIKKLRAPITEKKEEPKNEFDDILKFYGARFEDGGDVRQEYGLGSIVKKATRAVKKVVKSPIGKAALLGGLAYFGPSFLAGTKFGFAGTQGPLALQRSMKAARLGRAFGEFAGGLNPLTTILGTSLLAGGLSKEDEEDEKLPTVANTDPEMRAVLDYYGQRFAQGGEVEDEMLDLDGNEMDLRGGGFVPLGEYEKKDDVPARLSKNEFVFTADAVRAAGGGSVDKGADVMYKTMKTLENKVA